MPRLRDVRTLDLARASQRGRPRHLSAASGLVAVGDRWYVIADDESHLGIFPGRDRNPGTLMRLHPGNLPVPRKPRKRAKPDFEAIVALPPFAEHRFGALLALGSGSRANRRRGAIVALAADGKVRGPARAVDLSPLYRTIGREFGELNIEGAFTDEDSLALLQRGNKRNPRNARIDVELPAVLDALATGDRLPRPGRVEFTAYELGSIGGVPLGFTDGAPLGAGAFAFTAVAEDTADSYADGACAGSAIGIVRGKAIAALWRLEPALKVEGIVARPARNGLELVVVTDADDASVPGRLLRTVIAAGKL